jgi:hypothetical protein
VTIFHLVSRVCLFFSFAFSFLYSLFPVGNLTSWSSDHCSRPDLNSPNSTLQHNRISRSIHTTRSCSDLLNQSLPLHLVLFPPRRIVPQFYPAHKAHCVVRRVYKQAREIFLFLISLEDLSGILPGNGASYIIWTIDRLRSTRSQVRTIHIHRLSRPILNFQLQTRHLLLLLLNTRLNPRFALILSTHHSPRFAQPPIFPLPTRRSQSTV